MNAFSKNYCFLRLLRFIISREILLYVVCLLVDIHWPKIETKMITQEKISNLTRIKLSKNPILTNQKIGEKLTQKISNVKPLITTHACFNRLDENHCHHTTNQSDVECIWCEFWCVHNRQAGALIDCDDLSHELNKLYPEPIINQVQPKLVLANVTTMINIRGFYLDSASTLVYNNITSITFNDKYLCQIENKTVNLIQCLVTINQVTSFELKINYFRNIFDIQNEKKLETNHIISVIEDFPEQSSLENHYSISIWFKLVIGMLFCSLIWTIYDKRILIKKSANFLKIKFRLKKIEKILIEENFLTKYKEIEYKQKLGDGKFGQVFAAQVIDFDGHKQNVAIKRIKKANAQQIEAFVIEGIKTARFSHKNILSPLTTFIDHSQQMPAIVLPLMTNGDLGRFLRQKKSFSILKLTEFAFQIVEGMEYLASLNFVHGDLAARNCLLDDDFQIKIGDFGMSRQIYKQNYVAVDDMYRPIRWMAIECLSEKKIKLSLKSDVWSFGVVLWEIFTLGSYPYEELDGKDLILHLKNGYRLHQPFNCPITIYEIMKDCWKQKPHERPSFTALKQKLQLTLSNENFHPDEPTCLFDITNTFSNYSTLAECYIQSSSKKDYS